MLLALVCATVLATLPSPMNGLTLKMAAPGNNQYGVTPYEPQHLLKPYVPIRLTNPTSGKSVTIEAYLDTGADHCVINGAVFARLGLTRIGTATAKTFFGVGHGDLFPTEADYELLTAAKGLSGFAKQRTHLYVNEHGAEALILGVNGFLNRFKEVILRYSSQEMEFRW